jgi:Peptidase family M23
VITITPSSRAATRLPAAFLLAAALALTACSPSGRGASSAEPAPTTQSPSTAIASGPMTAPTGPTAATVPDAFTAVTVRPLSASTFPFPGSDGKYHIVYDLELTNASRVPATLDKVDVVDAANTGTVIASYSGTRLVQQDCPYGDCNRLRQLPSAPATDTAIPAQESRALFVDFTVDSPSQAPKTVLHHLYGHGAANPGSTAPVPIDYLAAPLDIAAGAPRVIGPPVKGDRWVALNGCCLPGFPHRTSLATFNGQLINGQRFAIDWKQADADGAFYTGDRTKNESYVDYGAAIYAVADGTVTSTLDELDPNPPGILPAADPVLAPRITVENVDGNHIVQDIGGGAYAFYAHLQKGSLLVRPGDKVTKGQVIAKLGNTGNAMPRTCTST